ncbi:TPA: hypothetical protein DIC20_05145 [Candidatus Dependentiae bacterium]|nr:MAG: hypothetical protein US13_C0016G0013 [candidate division TM6 bacterium GW2011_GWE2_36_25]KKQ18801.1 MAG: hypothetical protein US32_C0022G0006 [candidate division TM6 bacterium GW2011_GWA2_36_9]HBR70161.1 hypothetical protein [Candidatus Dependentiae bacterium]HCU01057.1 hypothetical protein [Candidatus Dependentiae bacterium]
MKKLLVLSILIGAHTLINAQESKKLNVAYNQQFTISLKKPYAGTGYFWTICNYAPDGPITLLGTEKGNSTVDFKFSSVPDRGFQSVAYIGFNLIRADGNPPAEQVNYEITIGENNFNI